MNEKKIPWSGWGWPSASYPPPMAKENGPLHKFDQYIEQETDKNPGTVAWEQIHHHHPNCSWCGHCHGWAAAAILEPEPVRPSIRSGITFNVGDLKGLLTEIHCTDSLDLWKGWRDVMPPYREDQLKATDFHWVMLHWVNNGEPVAMDIEEKPAVWNHPAYKCKMFTHPDRYDRKIVHVVCRVWFANSNVDPDYKGTRFFTKEYKYWIKGDFEDPSEGDWEQKDHPGFIWHPEYVDTTASGANPVAAFYHSHIKDLTESPQVMVFAVSELSFSAVLRSSFDAGPEEIVGSLLFRGLVSLHHSEGYPVPATATSWVVSEDGLDCTFYLQRGATFHDGSSLTAQDVVFTYLTMINPDSGYPYNKALASIVKEIQAVDETTVTFTLAQPMKDFPAAHGRYWILPQHILKEEGIDAFAAHPVGSGPFSFESGESDRLILTAFSDYTAGKPVLDKIIIVKVTNTEQRFSFITKGRADVAIFDYDPEIQDRAHKVPYLNCCAVPATAPQRLEIQSVRVQGRVPNQFDSAWNICSWNLDLKVQGPPLLAPSPPPGLFTRREERISERLSTESTWKKGMWWQILVQQRAIAAGISDPGWTLPFSMVFEILGESVVDNVPCYHIKVTYPDRPRSADYKYADVWISKDEHIPVKGILHIGDRNIPLQNDFLTVLLKKIPGREDTTAESGSLPDPRYPEEKTIKIFKMRTETGGKCFSSPQTPFPLRIEEPMYTVNLQDWED